MTSKVSESAENAQNPFLVSEKQHWNVSNVWTPFTLNVALLTIDNTLSYKNKKKDLICKYCPDYSCLKCDKHVYDQQPGIFCNICNLWVHRSCAGISKKEYEDLQNSDNDEPWYCRPCKINLFAFFELTNNQLLKLHENNKTKQKYK